MNIKPGDFLKQTLDPIGKVMDAQGAPHLLVGYVPGVALHVATNAGTAQAQAIRELANLLLKEADNLERKRPSLILPASMVVQ